MLANLNEEILGGFLLSVRFPGYGEKWFYPFINKRVLPSFSESNMHPLEALGRPPILIEN